MTLSEMVEAVAGATGYPKTSVRTMLECFIEETNKALEAGDRVILPRFGTFVPVDPKPRPLFGGKKMSGEGRRIRFRQSRRHPMEKLGVVIDEEKTKTASKDERCPKCGSLLYPRKTGDIPQCPNCGTEPFERRPSKK